MYTIYHQILGWQHRHAPNILQKMKLTTIILLTTLMQVSAASLGQTLSFTRKNTTLEQVFVEMEKQTGYTVLWPSNSLDNRKLDVEFNKTSLKEVMKKCLEGQDLTFVIENHTVVIRDKEKSIVDKLVDYFNLIDVSGRITDEQGKPLPGATVRIKNGGKATISDAGGRWSLSKIDENTVLVISFLGFKTHEVKVSGKSRIDVWLLPDMSELDDVVVVGYGTTKRKDLVGSVASINGDDLRKQVATNFTQGLVARAAGVQVSRSNGTPGSSASIRIRGMSTVTGVNDPLFVIDGIPVQLFNGGGSAAMRTESSRGLMDPLSGIDMNDIENVEILKDATGTAIYGSRAANGVIIVTTKKGKAGEKPAFTFSYDASVDRQNKFYDLLSGPQYVKLMKGIYEKAGQPIENATFPGNGDTDWQREVTQVGLVQNINLNLLGATKEGGTVYGFSTGLSNQKGILIKSGLKRYSVRANVESKVLRFFKVGTNLNFSSTTLNGGGLSPIFTNASALTYRPDISIYNPDGSYAKTTSADNPVAERQNTDVNESQRFLASAFAELEMIPGLKLRSTLAFDINNNVGLLYYPSWMNSKIGSGTKGTRRDRSYKYTNRIFDNTLNYTKVFDKHHIDVVSGASWTLNMSRSLTISSEDFPNDNVLNNLSSAGRITGGGDSAESSGLESFFMRANYDYDGIYYLSVSGRADNSTKFGPENQWGYFPSVGIAWRFSKEKFMEKLSFVDDAKLRVTTGKTGTSAFGTFGFLTLFNTGFMFDGISGVRANPDAGLPNPNIHWESTTQTDVALELSFLKSRVRTSVNYYSKYTKGLITGPGVPLSSGYTFETRNVGEVSNRGWEFTFSAIPVSNTNFTWISDLNLTFNKNKVEKTYGTTLFGRTPITEGLPLNGILGYRTNGLYQSKAEVDAANERAREKTGNPRVYYQTVQTSAGDVKYVDTNNDGIINAADREILGYAQNPKYFGGWNNTFRYKQFELSALLQFDVGSKLRREMRIDTFTGWGFNVSPKVLTAWTPENPNTNQPRNAINGPQQNIDTGTDRFIDDSSFLRLKNVQLSYVFQNNLLKMAYVQQIRVFAGVSNLLTWTKYKGLDPEANSENSFTDHGRDTGVYPQSRGMSFGVNFKF
ncbi:SusC/RagA family TonB-linked outer membrane protein [Chryseobacterium sp. MEBOG07]|uniref:SusC/RagA family TonB-linked outer membrane protein n=1 Tax=Chryseobacterium sp. MEBOG07 TaxID=2879939 RepID=UPI001F230363|nr:TonB-dependent receptor [Chryseobacterium sp. MEBOG07]UKB78584.1 TonB-dependent receptor [Chryseobacterium sp. MEBOG07]